MGLNPIQDEVATHAQDERGRSEIPLLAENESPRYVPGVSLVDAKGFGELVLRRMRAPRFFSHAAASCARCIGRMPGYRWAAPVCAACSLFQRQPSRSNFTELRSRSKRFSRPQLIPGEITLWSNVCPSFILNSRVGGRWQHAAWPPMHIRHRLSQR